MNKIHCVGIGGIGVSALARLFLSQGKIVTGSDVTESEIAKSLGIDIFIGHKQENVDDVDLVIYSDSVPFDNVERVFARQKGIKEMSYAQALGEISKEYKTIVVAGTHGKSTTTAMLGLILEKANLDPLVILGTRVPQWEYGNIRLSKKKDLLAVEGDDYRDHFLELSPYAVVVTNIDFDHPDYFKDLEQTVQSFQTLCAKAAIVFLNNHDPGCAKLKNQINFQGYDPIDFALKIPGEFNQDNAGAASAAALSLGIGKDLIKESLQSFSGVWRRFEIVGEFKGALIVSDYGHHPTAIASTMKAAREAYPDKRIVLAYQPHQHSRTKRLFDDFVNVLRDCADVVILSDIYAVKGRMEDDDVNSKDLAEKTNAIYGGDLQSTEKLLRDTIKPNDLVVVMGAGDIDKIARNLI